MLHIGLRLFLPFVRKISTRPQVSCNRLFTPTAMRHASMKFYAKLG